MIIHIDMDAFYASVEEREDPSLKGKSVIVGGRADARGVVAAANYAARRFGIHSAMPSATAVRLCPDLVVLPPRGAVYAAESAKIQHIFRRYTPVVEPLSLDETFLDPGGSEKLHGSAVNIAHKIKSEIRTELDLIASVGIAPNKFIAKLASDYDKPDGFTVVEAEQVQSFLDPMPVERIWGVGKSAARKLHASGMKTILDLRLSNTTVLKGIFGQQGERLFQLAQGLDDRLVISENEVKSISHETTFSRDIAVMESLESTLMTLVESVAYRLREAGLLGRTIQLKLRFSDFRTITRATSLAQGVDATRIIWQTVRQLLHRALAKPGFDIRLIGVAVSNFTDDPVQTDLFTDDTSAGVDPIDRLADDIRHRFGKTSIARGKGIKPKTT